MIRPLKQTRKGAENCRCFRATSPASRAGTGNSIVICVPATDFALHANLPAMRRDDLFCRRQPSPEPFGLVE